MKPSEFIHAFFANRSRATVCICSFANERDAKIKPRETFTRDPGVIDSFVRDHDKPGRAVYFSCATYRDNRRRKDNIADIVCLHADLDFKGIDEERVWIDGTIRRLRLQPTFIVFSGHGLHLYWLLKSATQDIARVERLLKRLAWALAGDPSVAEAARVMRLPGSHNSKFDEWTAVEILQHHAVDYTLDELDAWLKAMPVALLPRKDAESAPPPEEEEDDDAYAQVGREQIIPERLDFDSLWDGLQYFGAGGGGNLHETQLRVCAAMLSRGEPVDAAIAYIREQLTLRIPECASWDWALETRTMREQCISWFEKHPDLLEKQATKPQWLSLSARIRRLGGDHEPQPQPQPQPPPQPPPRIILDEATKAMMRRRPASNGSGNGHAGDNVVELRPGGTKPTKPEPVEIEWTSPPELQKELVEPATFLVPGLIVADALNGFFGEGAVGKDLILLQLAFAMTCDRPFLGMYVPQIRVMMINVEDSKRELRWRQAKIMENLTIIDTSADLQIARMLGKDTILAVYNSRTGLVQPTPLYDALCRSINRFKPQLVIVGNRVNSFAVNQNDDAQARQCLELLNRIIVQFKTAVIMPAHPSLSQIQSGDGSSGSVQWSNGCRQRLYLSRPPRAKQNEDMPPEEEEKIRNTRTLEVVKSNWGPSGKGIKLTWNNWSFFTDTYWEVDPAPRVGETKEQTFARVKMEKDMRDDEHFMYCLNKATALGQIVSSSTAGSMYSMPATFQRLSDCPFKGADAGQKIAAAFERAIASGKVKVIPYGYESRGRTRVVKVSDEPKNSD